MQNAGMQNELRIENGKLGGTIPCEMPGPSPWGEGGPKGRMRGRPDRRHVGAHIVRPPLGAPLVGELSSRKARLRGACANRPTPLTPLRHRLRRCHLPRKGGGFGPPKAAAPTVQQRAVIAVGAGVLTGPRGEEDIASCEWCEPCRARRPGAPS